ncbi:MAG: hypothetical protein ACTS45_00715 [Candidatus Hodgkinia cicadicola]
MLVTLTSVPSFGGLFNNQSTSEFLSPTIIMLDLVLHRTIKNELIHYLSSINLTAEGLMLQAASAAQEAILPFASVNLRSSFIDELERLASARAKALFNCNYACVLASDDCQTFDAVSSAMLQPEDTVLAPLGNRFASEDAFNSPIRVVTYTTSPSVCAFDVNLVLNRAILHKPKLIVVDASLSSQTINWKHFQAIANLVGALLVADISHASAAIIEGSYPSPVAYCHAVTCSTHFALRGPIGGLILTNDASLFEAFQRSLKRRLPQPHVLASKAAALLWASSAEFKTFARLTSSNANVLVKSLSLNGLAVHNSTACSLVFVNLSQLNLTAKQAQDVLNDCYVRVSVVPGIETLLRFGVYHTSVKQISPTEVASIAYFVAEALKQTSSFGIISIETQAKARRFALTLTRRFILPNLTGSVERCHYPALTYAPACH